MRITIYFSRVLTILLTVVFLVSACKSTDPTLKEPDKEPAKTDQEKVQNRNTAATFLAEHRTKLSDVYASRRHDYPENFKKKLETQSESGSQRFRGFRVQLVSTRNISIADSTQARYQRWLQENQPTIRPESYEFFQQPYYRVHVGDFQNRETANQFSRLLKDTFPEAWVVHDRINPERSPDTQQSIELTPDSLSKYPAIDSTAADSL